MRASSKIRSEQTAPSLDWNHIKQKNSLYSTDYYDFETQRG